jgi:glucan biosynthesis protein C
MVVVIAHHVAQAYGPTGAWWPVQEPARTMILDPFFTVNRSFGMSLFFMIAGYFTVQVCDKRGPQALVKSRLQRLGFPLLGFSVLMALLQVFVFGPLYIGELGSPWPINVIHFWFVQQLFIFSLGYALWRMLSPGGLQPVVRKSNPPGYGGVLAFAICLALLTTIVRTWYDIDEWVYLLGYIRVAFADLPRDLAMFLVGTLAYRHQWVTHFPSKAGQVWLGVGLFLAGFWYAYRWWLVDVIVLSDTIWGLLFPLWESLLCCSMCIGLITLFRDKINTQGPVAMEMAGSTYTAYMLHVFIAILFQYVALGLLVSPLLKFFLVTLITVPGSFLLASLIRRSIRFRMRRRGKGFDKLIPNGSGVEQGMV